MKKNNYLSLSSVPRSKAQRRLHGGELGTEREREGAGERESGRARERCSWIAGPGSRFAGQWAWKNTKRKS